MIWSKRQRITQKLYFCRITHKNYWQRDKKGVIYLPTRSFVDVCRDQRASAAPTESNKASDRNTQAQHDGAKGQPLASKPGLPEMRQIMRKASS